MPTDLMILAVAVVFCSVLFFLMAVAERGRFTDPPPPIRHRRRLSTPEIAMGFRDFIFGFGYVCLGLALLFVAAFSSVMRLLHRLDASRMRRFWGGSPVHS